MGKSFPTFDVRKCGDNEVGDQKVERASFGLRRPEMATFSTSRGYFHGPKYSGPRKSPRDVLKVAISGA